MLQKLMIIRVLDNTVAELGKVIHVFGGCGRKTYARLSGLIRVSVKKLRRLRPTLKVRSRRKKRILFMGGRRVSMVTRVRKAIMYLDGTYLHFVDNGAITFNKRRKFGGKRFVGVTTRFVGYQKIGKRFKMNI